MRKEIQTTAERLIEREILMRANTIIETLDAIGKIDFDAWENVIADNEEGELKEIYEYYFVSEWLAEKLIAIDEPVLRVDCLDFPVWGRTCTGQLIILDGTFQRIATNLMKEAV